MQRSRNYSRKRTAPKSAKPKIKNLILKIIIGLCFLATLFFSVQYHFNHDYSTSPNIKLATSGYCLDDYRDILSPSNRVDAWQCNSSRAQIWRVQGTSIVFDKNYCLSVANNSTQINANVVLDPCNNLSGQVWIRDQGGYQNPNSTLCLSAALNNPSQSVFISTCNLSKSIEVWSPVLNVNSTKILSTTCSGSEGELVACYAEKEWNTWQLGSINHNNLLNSYTNGSPYEEWCADFVSYVYKEAGFPFTQGSSSGWDENNANYVQYMGFTMHMASSGYIPKTGDVAYFNYNGGHVEIVISGGKNPAFIYGDSAEIDPTTGNGQMKANTILGDSSGQVVYYLTPS
jgi:hypothetical protein